MKKFISVLLALVLVFALSSTAMADDIEADTIAEIKAGFANGDNVKLVGNVVFDFATDAESMDAGKGIMLVPADTTATLDLNGYTITGVDDTQNAKNFYVIMVGKNAELTVYDNSTAKTGGISVSSTKDDDWNRMCTIFNVHGGTLNLKGGTFKNLGGTDMAYVVDVNVNHAPVTTLNVYDGVYMDTTYRAIRLFTHQNEAIVNIYGGEVNGDNTGIWAQDASGAATDVGVVSVKGGTVSGLKIASGTGSTMTTTISGGTVGDISAEASEINITGGTITGELTLKDASGNEVTEADVITGGSFTSGQDISGFIVGDPEIKEDYKGGIHVGEEAIANMPTPPAPKRYAVEVAKTENGDVTVKGSASYDSGVVITAAPHYGYEVGTVTVTKADGTKVDVTKRADGTYSFSMPRGEVTIKVTFVPQGELVKMVLTIGSKAVDVNGKAVASDVAPVIKASRTFLPVRLIAENLGAKVEWNNDAQTVTITKGDTVIVLTVGSTTVLVNGQPAELEAPVFIENSRTYLPVRFIAEKLGADVEWNGATNEVTIIGRK